MTVPKTPLKADAVPSFGGMGEPRAYTLEVFVKSVHAPGQQAISNYLGVAVRFLDFPMLLVRPVETTLDEQAVSGSLQEDCYMFSSGKSCVFSSQPEELAAQLSEVRAGIGFTAAYAYTVPSDV